MNLTKQAEIVDDVFVENNIVLHRGTVGDALVLEAEPDLILFCSRHLDRDYLIDPQCCIILE